MDHTATLELPDFPGFGLLETNSVYLRNLLLHRGQIVAASDMGGLLLCRLPRGRFLMATVSHNFDFVPPPNTIPYDQTQYQVYDYAFDPIGQVENVWHYPQHDIALVVCTGAMTSPVPIELVDPPPTDRDSTFCFVVPHNTMPGSGTCVVVLNEAATDAGRAIDQESLVRKSLDSVNQFRYDQFKGVVKNRDGLLRKGWCPVRQLMLPTRPGCSGMPVFDVKAEVPTCYGIIRGGDNPHGDSALNSLNRADIIPSSEIAKALAMFRKVHAAYLK